MLRFRSGGEASDVRGNVGEGSQVRIPSFVKTFFIWEKGFPKYVFKRLTFSTFGIKFPTLLNLTHQFRVAQNVERFFQTFVFRKIDQHGCGFSLPCDHDFFFSLLNTRDKLRKTGLYFGDREGLRHDNCSPTIF